MEKILQFFFSGTTDLQYAMPVPSMYAVLEAHPYPNRVLYIANSMATTTDLQYAMRFDSAVLAMQYKIDYPSIAPEFNVAIYPAGMFINQ